MDFLPRVPLTRVAHQHLQKVLTPGALAIDATAGNGFDTLFLAQAVGSSGKVIAFDVQAHALEATARRLQIATTQLPAISPFLPPEGVAPLPATPSAPLTLAPVCLVQDSHARLRKHVPPQWVGHVCAITFNLGYLPGGDKTVVTESTSTLSALDACLPLLSPQGLLSIVCYRGHPQGVTEAQAVATWAECSLAGQGFVYRFTDASADAPPHAPRLLHVRRKQP